MNNIESLTQSAIRYLAITLAADSLTGTKVADTLLRMEFLQQADMSFLDRSSPRRYTVLENQLKKAGKVQLLDASLEMKKWVLL